MDQTDQCLCYLLRGFKVTVRGREVGGGVLVYLRWLNQTKIGLFKDVAY